MKENNKIEIRGDGASRINDYYGSKSQEPNSSFRGHSQAVMDPREFEKGARRFGLAKKNDEDTRRAASIENPLKTRVGYSSQAKNPYKEISS